MKTVKTIMSILVIFAMLISLIVPALAENRMTISITNAIVKAGEEVTLDVHLENNPGFNYLKLKIEYSPYMSIKSVKDNKLFDFMMPTPGNKEANPYAYVYAAAEDEYSSGKLFSITFEVSADAPIKDHFVAVAVEQCLNQSKENVDVETMGSMISVIKNDTVHEHSYTSVVTAPTCTEKGYTTYTCECGDSYKDNYVDATGSHADVDKNYKCDYCDADLPRLPVTGGDDYNDDYSLGDVNDDGKITAADARTILRASARLETLSEIQSLAADIDGNGKLAASDARIALRISARLDSIDNYIKEEPPVDERTDLSVYLGVHVSDFTDIFPEFVFEDGVTAYDGVAISLDDSDCICDITDTGSEGFSVFGVNGNTPYDEARAIFENAGFVFEDDETAFNSELGLYLWVFVGEDMTAYNVYFMTDDEVVFDNDLAMNLGCDIGLYLDNIPDLVEDEEDSSHFFTDYLDIFTDNGLVFDIIINGQCDYSIYGVAYGSTYEEAEENLAFYGFVYDEENDCWYNELFEEYVLVYYDENSLVDVVDVLVDSEEYPENELLQYLNCNIEEVESVFGDLELHDEGPTTGGGSLYYYYDGIYFYVDEENYIYNIEMDTSNDYFLHGLYIEETFYSATEYLADSESYYSCYDGDYICIENYTEGYSVYLTFDETERLSFISVFAMSFNLASYHMTDIETILSDMPYLEKDENIYYIPEFSFEVNENGYINAVILDSYNYCDINGVYVGMSGSDVEEILSWSGFTYLHTDEEGDDFYINDEEDLYMYVVLDDMNNVSCVCIYG
ncbi:MAG: hypothetical protein IJ289_07965 [Clostridia bacterium]|nr:hypothetical protein [Clostridia bacterium]